jgi:hypothetical protein
MWRIYSNPDPHGGPTTEKGEYVDEPVSEDPKTENVLQKEELCIIGEENFIESLNCVASLEK